MKESSRDGAYMVGKRGESLHSLLCAGAVGTLPALRRLEGQ